MGRGRVPLTAYIEIVGAGVIWATTGPFVRHLKNLGWSPWDIVLGRALFSTLFMGLWLLAKWHARRRSLFHVPDEPVPDRLVPDRNDLFTFIALGFVAVMMSQITYFYALSVTTVAVAVTLNYTAPFFVLIISLLFLGEKVTREKVIALIMALAGVVLISGLGEKDGALSVSPAGFLAGLLSGVSYGAQTVVYKKLGRKYGPVSLNFWTMAFGGTILFCALSAWRGGVTGFGRALPMAWSGSLLYFALMGLGPGTAAFILFADGINKVEATRGSIAALSEPLAAYVIGYLFLGETLSVRGAIGALFVVSAIWVVSVSQAARTPKATRTSER